jgi:hypothetical protein
MEKYRVAFDRTNSNSLIFSQGGKIIKVVNCPPVDNNCDIINFADYTSPQGYKFDFSGLVLITDTELRQLYYKGMLVDMIHRKTQ